MFSGKNVKKVTMFFVVWMFGLGLIGCGGGGGDTSYVPPKEDQAKIGDANAKQVASLVLASTKVDPSIPGIVDANRKIVDDYTDDATVEDILVEQVVRAAKSVDGYCESGSTDISGTAENMGTVTFDECKIGNTTLDGVITVSRQDYVTTIQLSGFKVLMGNGDHVFYSDAKLVFEEISSAEYKLSLSMSGDAIVNGRKFWYRDFKIEIKTADSTAWIKVNGYMKDDCLNMWIKLETLETVVVKGNSCPESGKIKATGDDSSLTITSNSDGSVDVEVEGGSSAHYDNCSQISNSCTAN